jgi:hypothetical protein
VGQSEPLVEAAKARRAYVDALHKADENVLGRLIEFARS